jgi:hypothetical protein
MEARTEQVPTAALSDKKSLPSTSYEPINFLKTCDMKFRDIIMIIIIGAVILQTVLFT